VSQIKKPSANKIAEGFYYGQQTTLQGKTTEGSYYEKNND
jgi:hypothetical protein